MGSERGFVSVRLLVLLGLVVAAVWVVPLTLLQSEATHPTTSAGPTAVGPTAWVRRRRIPPAPPRS